MPAECPFPTIVKNALKRTYGEEKVKPTLSPEEETNRTEAIVSVYKRNVEALRIKNIQLSDEIKSLEKKVKFLEEDNAVLRSIIKKLKEKLEKRK